jgi:hypothetical protein
MDCFCFQFPITINLFIKPHLSCKLYSGRYIEKPKLSHLEKATPHVEAGQNASTVALQVTEGNKKGTRCPKV